MTDAQIDAVFEKYDKNKDGKLDFGEFKDLMEARSKSQEEEERTLQHQKQDRLVQRQHSSCEKPSSTHPGTSPTMKGATEQTRPRLQMQVTVERELSPRRKSLREGVASPTPPKN